MCWCWLVKSAGWRNLAASDEQTHAVFVRECEVPAVPPQAAPDPDRERGELWNSPPGSGRVAAGSWIDRVNFCRHGPAYAALGKYEATFLDGSSVHIHISRSCDGFEPVPGEHGPHPPGADRSHAAGGSGRCGI